MAFNFALHTTVSVESGKSVKSEQLVNRAKNAERFVSFFFFKVILKQNGIAL